MAGVAAAWELSRPGWRDRFDAITLYQRGWLLGGKGASTRDAEGRILEHGLHVWPGYYDNAFRLVRECYAELDREHRDPDCPIRSWLDAFAPSPAVGVFEHVGSEVDTWLARFRTNGRLPGSGPGRDDDVGDLVRKGIALTTTLLTSTGQRRAARTETAIDLLLTALRGISADGLLRAEGGFGRVDDEDFRAWLRRHGARPATVDGGLVRAMYDLVFGYRDGDRSRPAFAAGLGVFLAIRLFLDYKGSLFWKMTAGMGDVVFAPFQEALVARGVEIRYFHRVDALETSADGSALTTVVLTRQLPGAVATGYDPLVRVDGLPCFPDRPNVAGGGIAPVPTEERPGIHEGERIVLRRDQDFDHAVLAVSLGALPRIAAGVVRRSPRWQEMLREVATVPTRSVQLWFRDDEAALGWRHPGATIAGLDAPFDTCASMTHLLPVERWPQSDAPRSLAYLCSVQPNGGGDVATDADAFVRGWSPVVWPRAPVAGLDDAGVRSYHTVANADPSDRYVQSLPGSDRFRLRVDGSGVDGLTLAGDWTDCGINAGCIEAAAVSGIEAAAAVEGRPLTDRVLGPLTWDWS
jgi:uncharacterized protein with NAD-binding domain and iron-sulfur cluster